MLPKCVKSSNTILHIMTSSKGNIFRLPFLRGNHRSPVDSSHKGKWREAFMFSMMCAWTNIKNKQTRRRRLETPLRSLWRHCNGTRFLGDMYPKHWYQMDQTRDCRLLKTTWTSRPFVSVIWKYLVRMTTLRSRQNRRQFANVWKRWRATWSF